MREGRPQSPRGARPAKERCKQGDEEERQVRGNHVNANLWKAAAMEAVLEAGSYLAVMEAGGDGKPLWRPAASILRHWKVLSIEIGDYSAMGGRARNRSISTTFERPRGRRDAEERSERQGQQEQAGGDFEAVMEARRRFEVDF